MRASVKNEAIRNGATATTMRLTGSREISAAANRQTARGGVKRPILRLTIIKTPKWTRSDPAPYHALFEEEKEDIGLENTYFWELNL